MKSIYTYYKQRLVEISGKNRSLFSRKITKKNSFDIGKLFDGDYDAIENLVDFLWSKSEDSFNLLSKEQNPRLYKNLGLEQKFSKDVEVVDDLEGNAKVNAKARLDRRKREEYKKAVTSQVNNIKALKREIEEFEKETGRYELYVGYPFVQGYIGKDFEVKAPLVLFPVNIDVVDETTVNIEIRQNEDIQLNRVLMLAYAQQQKVKNFEELEMNVKGSMTAKFKTLQNLVEYLRKFGIKIAYSQRKGLFDYERAKDVPKGHGLEIKHFCVLGRYPLANAIYNDYELLEKTKDYTRIIVVNKNDQELKFNMDEAVYISSVNKDLKELEVKIKEIFKDLSYNDEPLLFNARQLGLLNQAKAHLLEAKRQAENGQVIDLISIDLKQAYICILEILGKNNAEGLLDNIFSKFCLGK